jgi:hypothetical protein
MSILQVPITLIVIFELPQLWLYSLCTVLYRERVDYEIAPQFINGLFTNNLILTLSLMAVLVSLVSAHETPLKRQHRQK